MIYYSKALSESANAKVSDIVKVINSLPDLYHGTPATEEQVKKAEKDLSLKFADDYKEYLLNFGEASSYGIELTGISKDKNNVDVVTTTKREWSYNDMIKHNLYLIENYGIDSILIWQDSSGKIWESRPYREPFVTQNSLAEFLKDETKAIMKSKKGKK